MAEARNVSSCCSRCNFNSFGKALLVADFPVNSKSIHVLDYYILPWCIMNEPIKLNLVVNMDNVLSVTIFAILNVANDV